jgi:hypothetical protein
MKILIAYDGSESADKGLDDLSRAALPAEVEALVVSVAEVWLPPPQGDFDDTFPQARRCMESRKPDSRNL